MKSQTASPTRRPSIDRAFARVSRAEEHIAELIRRTLLHGQKMIEGIQVHPNPKNPNRVIVKRPELPLALSFSVIVGEICYNLRSALDYMVYELAVLDSGADVEGTQFPIEDKKKGFEWRVGGGWLKGLNTAHLALVENLQPYSGCDWTSKLRDLSNPDKHRSLVATQADHELTIHVVDKDHLSDFADLPGAVRPAKTSEGKDVYIKALLTTTLQLTDGTPIIETLEKIKNEVAKTLAMIAQDFNT